LAWLAAGRAVIDLRIDLGSENDRRKQVKSKKEQDDV
jgi:hypothetical protein